MKTAFFAQCKASFGKPPIRAVMQNKVKKVQTVFENIVEPWLLLVPSYPECARKIIAV